MNKISTLIYRIKHSIWYIPSLFIITTLLLFSFLIAANLQNDALLSFYQLYWKGFLGSSAYNLLGVATNVVSTIFALSISLTMIVLTLASAQLGPRIIDHFLGNKITQIIIGLYLSTILFLMLLNARVGTDAPQNEVPLAALTLAYLLAITSPGLMVYFVQHLVSSIIPDNVAKHLSESLSRAVDRYIKNDSCSGQKKTKFTGKYETKISAPFSGYLFEIKKSDLLKYLTEHHFYFEARHLPGHFIVKGADLGTLYSRRKKILDEHKIEIEKRIKLSAEMPVVNDVEFFLRKIVEVALRALSPGINDPYTAHACLNYIFTSLQPIALTENFSTGVYVDDKNTARLYCPRFVVEKMYDLAIYQIHEASMTSIDTQLHLLELICTTLTSPLQLPARKKLNKYAQEVSKSISKNTTNKMKLKELEILKERILSVS